MMRQFIYSLFFLLIVQINTAHGQEARVKASLDTSMMLIGDHVEFALSVNMPQSAEAAFPVITDTLTENIEVLRDLPFDTILDNGMQTIRKPYIVTSFDSGSYEIKPYPVAVSYNNEHTDTLHSNPVYLGVTTFNIDSAANSIADIKKPIETPLTFREFMSEYAIYAGIIILALALIITLWWYYKKQQKQKEAAPVKPKPTEPPHVIALRELDELQGKKLWQKDKVKLHYSILSDIVRKYLEYRFDVPALENTTGFIEDYLYNNKILNNENFDKVKDILETADLAKFAKFTPLPDDNARTLDYAYQVVISTKARIVEPETDNEAQEK